MLVVRKENIEKLKTFNKRIIDENIYEYYSDRMDTDGLFYLIRFSRFENYGYFNMEISLKKYKLGLLNYSILYSLIKENILENI